MSSVRDGARDPLGPSLQYRRTLWSALLCCEAVMLATQPGCKCVCEHAGHSVLLVVDWALTPPERVGCNPESERATNMKIDKQREYFWVTSRVAAWPLPSGVLMLLLVSSFLVPSVSAQGFKAAEYIPKAQDLVHDFSCPDDAYPKACDSFRDLASAGNEEFLAPFAFLFLPHDKVISAAWVVFDNATDNFWIISSSVHNDKKGKIRVLTLYNRYQNGLEISSQTGEVPFERKPVRFVSEDRTTSVEYDGTTIIAIETFKNLSTGRPVTTKIVLQKSTARHNIFLTSNGHTTIKDGTALLFE